MDRHHRPTFHSFGDTMPSIPRHVPRVALALIVLAGPACSLPFTKSSDERKAACDRITAAAIQTSSLEEAKNLTARASACYAELQTR
jgi:hypothetical protein